MSLKLRAPCVTVYLGIHVRVFPRPCPGNSFGRKERETFFPFLTKHDLSTFDSNGDLTQTRWMAQRMAPTRKRPRLDVDLSDPLKQPFLVPPLPPFSRFCPSNNHFLPSQFSMIQLSYNHFLFPCERTLPTSLQKEPIPFPAPMPPL